MNLRDKNKKRDKTIVFLDRNKVMNDNIRPFHGDSKHLSSIYEDLKTMIKTMNLNRIHALRYFIDRCFMDIERHIQNCTEHELNEFAHYETKIFEHLLKFKEAYILKQNYFAPTGEALEGKNEKHIDN